MAYLPAPPPRMSRPCTQARIGLLCGVLDGVHAREGVGVKTSTCPKHETIKVEFSSSNTDCLRVLLLTPIPVPIYSRIYPPTHQPIRSSTHLPTYPTVSLSIRQPIHPSIRPSTHPCLYPSSLQPCPHPSTLLSTYSSTHIPTHPCIPPPSSAG